MDQNNFIDESANNEASNEVKINDRIKLIRDHSEELKNLRNHEIFKWYDQNYKKTGTRQEFVSFTKILKKELGIEYRKKTEIRTQDALAKQNEILEKATKKIILTTDASFKHNKYAIIDENDSPLKYGINFDNNYDNQFEAELDGAIKAIYLANQIKKEFGLEYLVLNLKTDNIALTYQDKAKQKGFVLSEISSKLGIGLLIEHIEGSKQNPADKYTRSGGYQKFDCKDQKKKDYLKTLLKDWNGTEYMKQKKEVM